MVLVLCTGDNPALVRTRQLLLERAGYSVITAIVEPEIAAACKKTPYDVAVLCQQINRELKKKASVLIRKHCPSAKILELYEASAGRQLADADAWLEAPADLPTALAEKVAALLPEKKRPQKKLPQKKKIHA